MSPLFRLPYPHLLPTSSMLPMMSLRAPLLGPPSLTVRDRFLSDLD
jgi:hypothetical protein